MQKFQRLLGFAGTCLMLLCALLIVLPAAPARAQQPAAAEKPYVMPRNLKVLEQYSDGKGNIVRVVQFNEGNMRVTQTLIIPKPLPSILNVPIMPDTINKDSVLLVVEKSKYCVQVYYKKRLIRRYKAVFGPRPMEDKLMEGDRCTPEGAFRITHKNPNSKFDKFLGISYPSDSTLVRFNKLKAAGVIPSHARVGSAIGIHGIWQGGDDVIEMGVGWTDGCVALKNRDVQELYSFVGVGTRVVIRK